MTKPGEKDVKQTLQSTWPAKAHRNDEDDGSFVGYSDYRNENSDYRQYGAYNVRSSPDGGARSSRMHRPYFSSGGPAGDEGFAAATVGFSPSQAHELADSAAFTEKISRELEELTRSISKK